MQELIHYLQFGLWWLALGVASSIGLGKYEFFSGLAWLSDGRVYLLINSLKKFVCTLNKILCVSVTIKNDSGTLVSFKIRYYCEECASVTNTESFHYYVFCRIWFAHICIVFGPSYSSVYHESRAVRQSWHKKCPIWHHSIEKGAFMDG